ncbi:DUF134 domain-containing protein [Salinispira pacifica]|uniref:Uncharacterized protein n=1 Tax=Salinispira pacifica TaxID=1307761 RepID=V5WIL0_9SPIO|nr:DUF134 domain-containing protein [Salinispira pacifica]AHC15662.1 hypothetical protein L21SP2_2305 [Salinispira pacifica]
MPGRRKRRNCRSLEGGRNFKPSGVPSYSLERISLDLDEFEAVRLCDHEGKSQIEAARIMEISRGTVQRLLESGRWKITEILLHNHELVIPESPGDDAQ